jgi:hypothetical protein
MKVRTFEENNKSKLFNDEYNGLLNKLENLERLKKENYIGKKTISDTILQNNIDISNF